jgi:NADH-quinone oxidoreductase subunit A
MHNLVTVTIFVGMGVVMVLTAMVAGALLRPKLPGREKGMPYECGERPLGESWVQFDLRFYIVALVFLVFDVELALFYPWASVYQVFKTEALIDMIIFFGVLMVGYVYLWRFGYLEWVRSAVTTSIQTSKEEKSTKAQEMARRARTDPEFLES